MTNHAVTNPKFLDRFRWAYLFFYVVSALMLRSSKIFQSTSGMTKTHFGFKGYTPDQFKNLTSYFREEFLFYSFFFISDLIYMVSICWVIYTLYNKIELRNKNLMLLKDSIPYYFISFGALSLILDILENLSYLTGRLINPIVETLKELSISLFILGFLIYVIMNLNKDQLKKIKIFLKSSYISIAILAIVGIGMTFMPQGFTLIVHLFDSHSIAGLISIVCTVFFINILAILTSHYPKYIEFRNLDDKRNVIWHLTNQFRGVGIITYQQREREDSDLIIGRYSLGILTYFGWMYVIYKTWAIYSLTWFEPFSATALISISFMLVAGLFYLRFRKNKDLLFRKMNEGQITNDDMFVMREWVKKYINWLIFTFLLGGICLFIIYRFGWHTYTYIFSLLFIGCNAMCFLLFRITRDLMVYAGGNKDQIKWIKRKDYYSVDSIINTLNAFQDVKEWSYILKGRLWKYLVGFSSNYIFLKRIQNAGIITLILFLTSNVLLVLKEVSHFSAIPIFLSFLVIAYIINMQFVKHMIFYNNIESTNYYIHKRKGIFGKLDLVGYQVSNKDKRRFININLGILFLGFFILYGLKGVKNFHRMNFTATKSSMHVDEYSGHLETHLEKNNISKLVKVASYGGGLKSNLWNLLVLNQIENEVESQGLENSFLDYCFSFSGVSGGAVGLGNYLALDYSVRHYDVDKLQAIENIGNENILAVDMAGVLIHDLFFNTVKLMGESRNKDRSYYAMEQYIKIICNNDERCIRLFSNSSQQHVWNQMFESRDHLPALIVNTASTGPFPGVAFSLKSKNHFNNESGVFPGYILLEEDARDLRYYDAISTSNRFPIMSPSAQVENKGIFLDGGYFENSGLFSSSHFQKYLRIDSDKLKKTPINTITIINSKSDYVRKFVGKYVDEAKVLISSSTDASAILKGLTDINKLPNVLGSTERRFLDGKDMFMSVYLPHLISASDIEELYGGKVILTPELLGAIQMNNTAIRNALVEYASENALDMKISTHGIVEPPLARTLSKYSVLYQQAMISNFDDTQEEIYEIVDWLKK